MSKKQVMVCDELKCGKPCKEHNGCFGATIAEYRDVDGKLCSVSLDISNVNIVEHNMHFDGKGCLLGTISRLLDELQANETSM